MDVKKFTQAFSQIIPKLCHLCRQTIAQDGTTHRSHFLCKGCLDDLALNTHCCSCCAVPMPSSATRQSAVICGECLKRPPAYSASFCPFIYTFPVDHLISNFKSSGTWQYANHLGQLFYEKLSMQLNDGELNRPEIISYVPLHYKRRWQRGFNQSELLAKKIATQMEIPVVDSIRKIRETSVQHTLKRTERMKNLKYAFSAKKHSGIQGKYVALVDDVVTTGATTNVLAKLLIDAGARRVDIWALARTPKGKQ